MLQSCLETYSAVLLVPCIITDCSTSTNKLASAFAMFVDVPIDEMEMHPFAPPPTEDEFLAASTRPVHVWVLETAISLKPETRMLVEHIGMEMFDTYLNNMSTNTRMMGGCDASVWIWCATEWLADEDVLQQLLHCEMAYHPFVWNDSDCLGYESLEAMFWDSFLMEHDCQSYQIRCALNISPITNDDPNVSDIQPRVSSATANVAVEPACVIPNTVMYAFLIKKAWQYLDMANSFAVYDGNTLIAHRVENSTPSTRIVFGFFEGRFNTAEMSVFVDALADSAGVVPKAEDLLQHSDDGLKSILAA